MSAPAVAATKSSDVNLAAGSGSGRVIGSPSDRGGGDGSGPRRLVRRRGGGSLAASRREPLRIESVGLDGVGGRGRRDRREERRLGRQTAGPGHVDEAPPAADWAGKAHHEEDVADPDRPDQLTGG